MANETSGTADGDPVPLVRMTREGGVATVVLDSVHNRNALSRRLLVQLAAELDAAEADPGVRVIVLTGAGPTFCAGADLREQQDGLGQGSVSMPDILNRIFEHRCPVVARVNGTTRAGGVGLMAACDLVVVPDTATFAFSEVRIGVVPAVIAVPVLLRMNATVAHEYFLTGEVFDAAVAERSGLVNRAVPEFELDDAVTGYVDALTRGGPLALAAAKQLRRTVPGVEPRRAFPRLQELSEHHFASEEGQAGISAFRARRPAPWMSGR
ncbi:enoyl-CoA hydratase-related protein [Actinoallomurus purpureus]|uniref:enoyl-CoA hydratase-related protein n=1 Tax=Actinoallomurus purpureus TaxID=478114 RepID=UPI0020923CCA|nr:enoyl-CoA hydratase-related protein [Actinoallomurus purpureus]MCO6010447.1 enoyl-CoA hydratase-related protein [Actinoallomurus purpureus]